jgi:hypothetical protein
MILQAPQRQRQWRRNASRWEQDKFRLFWMYLGNDNHEAPRLLKMLDERDDLKTIVVDALAFHGKRFAEPAHDGDALNDEVPV